MDSTCGEVDAIPGEAQHFPLAHTCEQSDGVKRFKFVPPDGLNKRLCLQLVQRVQLRALHTGQRTSACRIEAQQPGSYGLLQRFVQNAVNILDGFGRHRNGLVHRYAVPLDNPPGYVSLWHLLAAFCQSVIKLLDGGRVQGFQTDSAQGGLDMVSDMRLIGNGSKGLDTAQIGICPGIQPLPHRLLAGCNIGTAADGCRNLCQLLGYFFLCLAGDRALHLLSGSRIMPGGVSGFPPLIFFTGLFIDLRFLANVAHSACISSGHVKKTPFQIGQSML